MNSKILISPNPELIKKEIEAILDVNLAGGSRNHPDILYFEADSKLGIAEARKIRNHFSIKPYSAKGRVVVLEDASTLTVEAQNALLKTLEEPPEGALLLLGAKSESDLLSTVLSRCQIIILPNVIASTAKQSVSESNPTRIASSTPSPRNDGLRDDIEKLLSSSIEERFEYIEKLKEREEFLHSLVVYFQTDLHSGATPVRRRLVEFLKELLQAEEWAAQNVNIRGILEYLMLVMPLDSDS